MVDQKDFAAKAGIEPWQPLMEVADFNSLIAFSQEHQVPVFALEQKHTDQTGAIWDRTEQSMMSFEQAFDEFAERLLKLTA